MGTAEFRDGAYMRKLADREVHFELKAGLMGLDHSIVRDLADPGSRRDMALDIAADALFAHFSDCEIFGPDRGPR